MSEEKPQDQKLQLVLTDEEWARYLKLLGKAKGGNPRLKNSDINRILLGLAPPTKDVTPEDIELFRGGESVAGVGRASKGKPEGRTSAGKQRKENGGQNG